MRGQGSRGVVLMVVVLISLLVGLVAGPLWLTGAWLNGGGVVMSGGKVTICAQCPCAGHVETTGTGTAGDVCCPQAPNILYATISSPNTTCSDLLGTFELIYDGSGWVYNFTGGVYGCTTIELRFFCGPSTCDDGSTLPGGPAFCWGFTIKFDGCTAYTGTGDSATGACGQKMAATFTGHPIEKTLAGCSCGCDDADVLVTVTS